MTSDRSLPDGWRWARFGDVVQQVKDKVDPQTAGLTRYVAGEHMDTDDLRLQRWGDVDDSYLGPAFHMRFRPGQVLYGSRRTYLRKVAVADFEGICANTTFVLEPSSADLLPEFLPQVMSTERFHEHSVQQSKGSVNPYINFRDLTWYEFALPPLSLQHEAVEVLAALDAVRERTMPVSDACEALAGALVVSTAEATSELSDLASCCRHPISYGIVQPGSPVSDGVPFVNVEDLTAGPLQRKHLPTTAEEVSEKHWRTLLEPGDVLVALRGPIGLAAVADSSLAGANLSRGVARLAPAPHVDSHYLAACLSTPFVSAQIERTRTGSTFKELKIGALRALRIPVPPLPAQRDLASRLQGVAGLGAAAADFATAALALRGPLLTQLMEPPQHV